MTTTSGSRGLWAATVCTGALLACGAPSGGSVCDERLPGDLVVTEFLADPEGVDAGHEYIELFNSTGQALALEGMTLYVSKADGTAENTDLFTGGTIPARGYFVAGDVRDGAALPEWVDYSYDAALGSLPNTGGIIGVRCGPTKLDEVKYETAAKPNAARVLGSGVSPDAIANDDPERWCDSKVEHSSGAFGSPGSPNENCPEAGRCRDASTGAVRAVRTPDPGDLVITEVMNNSLAEPEQEWLEVLALADFDLDGLLLGNQSITAPPVGLEPNPDGTCQQVTAGSFRVIARSRDTEVNAGLTHVAATFSSPALTNQNDSTVRLLTAAGVVLDEATFNVGTDGASWQLDPQNYDPALNDSASVFCPSSNVYGPTPNKGSPGAPNVPCSGAPVSGTACTDSNGSRDIVSPNVGQLVISEFMANPAGTAAGIDGAREWVELYATASFDLNGVVLRDASTSGSHTIASTACLRVNAGQHVVLAKSDGYGGSVAKVSGMGSVTLNNTGTEELNLLVGATVIDSVRYGAAQAIDGVASQLSASRLTAADNDVATSFCAATDVYDGADKGTPGTANAACP